MTLRGVVPPGENRGCGPGGTTAGRMPGRRSIQPLAIAASADAPRVPAMYVAIVKTIHRITQPGGSQTTRLSACLIAPGYPGGRRGTDFASSVHIHHKSPKSYTGVIAGAAHLFPAGPGPGYTSCAQPTAQ
jgi:hypothetical protein